MAERVVHVRAVEQAGDPHEVVGDVVADHDGRGAPADRHQPPAQLDGDRGVLRDARPDQRDGRVDGIGRALEEPAVERLPGLVVHRAELGEHTVDRRPAARLAVDEDEMPETRHHNPPVSAARRRGQTMVRGAWAAVSSSSAATLVRTRVLRRRSSHSANRDSSRFTTT